MTQAPRHDRGVLLTFGHGTASADDIATLLGGAGVELLVDIRRFPGSRRHPHVARTELEQWLPARGIAYRWEPRLGGRRPARPDAPDTALRDRAFAGYAAHMRSPEFLTAVDELLAEAATRQVAVMCAESLWWRCHRRLLADHLTLARNVTVQHLMHDGRRHPHVVSDLARLRGDGLLVYDAGQVPLS